MLGSMADHPKNSYQKNEIIYLTATAASTAAITEDNGNERTKSNFTTCSSTWTP